MTNPNTIPAHLMQAYEEQKHANLRLLQQWENQRGMTWEQIRASVAALFPNGMIPRLSMQTADILRIQESLRQTWVQQLSDRSADVLWVNPFHFEQRFSDFRQCLPAMPGNENGYLGWSMICRVPQTGEIGVWYGPAGLMGIAA